MENLTGYREHHQQLLRDLRDRANQLVPAIKHPVSDEEQTLLQDLKALADAGELDEHGIALGQRTLCKIVSLYSNLAPHIHPDLFWYFGGDCMHFIPDEDIARYQALDEARYEAESSGETFHYQDARAKIFGLH
ncbi:PA2817 family protein [Biformimicrobium ophioploci]|uniref:PA2817 family protein n=1 Tax=Biformimicrobium ophioploci TaxID=3036711 RepID=A0ABQ6LY43_9GAMM|nr:PA2817 family protein [Microbulbifer sp. NKW57]GMG87014.1 PA2817 family protein [Microbulbifer sp. NKW57]